MNTQTPTPTQALWTDEFLNPKRLIGDLLADDTIRAIMDDRQQLGLKGQLDGFLKLLTKNRSFDDLKAQHFPGISPELVKIVDPYFTESGNIPAYTDLTQRVNHIYQLNSAADEFKDQLVPILLTLHCKSLPLSYACANGAKVLHQAGRMVVHDQSLKQFTRRLIETAQFVNNLLAKNGFDLEGEGNAIISVQKVRLMHAAIRYYTTLPKPIPWKVEEYGVPINQEDLALGHLIFSSVIISGLRKFGIDVSTLQEGYYLYLWRTVAHVLGILPELVPQNQADGEYLLQRIMDRQAKHSDEGVALTSACIDFIDNKLHWLPIKRVAPRLMRFLLGDTYARNQEYPDPGVGIARILLIPGTPEPGQEYPGDFGLISTLFPRWDTTKESNLLFKWIGRLLLHIGFDEGLKAYNEPPKDQFFVPSSLSDYLNQRNPSAILEAGPTAESLNDVIRPLNILTKWLKLDNNPLSLFSVICQKLVKAVQHGNSTGKFVNKDLIESVYLKTVNRFIAEITHISEGKAVAGPWSSVLQTEKQLITIDQHLLLAGYIHLAYDLISVISDPKQVPTNRLASFEADYRRILDLFAETFMESIEVLGQIHRDYGWLAGLFYEPARNTLFNTFKTEIGEAWSFVAQLPTASTDSQMAHRQQIVTIADRLANPTDNTASWLRKLAQRQFPSNEPDQSAAAKTDTLLAQNLAAK